MYVYTSILGCPELEIENGEVTVEMEPGINVAKYSCMSGTMLFGNATRYCYTSTIVGFSHLLPHLWSGIKPICRRMYAIVITWANCSGNMTHTVMTPMA